MQKENRRTVRVSFSESLQGHLPYNIPPSSVYHTYRRCNFYSSSSLRVIYPLLRAHFSSDWSLLRFLLAHTGYQKSSSICPSYALFIYIYLYELTCEILIPRKIYIAALKASHLIVNENRFFEIFFQSSAPTNPRILNNLLTLKSFLIFISWPSKL